MKKDTQQPLERASHEREEREVWGTADDSCRGHDRRPRAAHQAGAARDCGGTIASAPATSATETGRVNLLTLQLASKRPDISRAREGCVWRDLDGSVCGRSLIAGHDRWLDWYDVGLLAFNDRSPVVKVWPVRGMTLESARAEFDRMLRRSCCRRWLAGPARRRRADV